MRKIIIFVASLLATFCLGGAQLVQAAVAPGDLIKLADDRNPDTTVDSAVYYVGSDSKRYAFPNAQTYFTWYADFSSVKVVSASELASLTLGGNITYRPGTRLIKIVSDPNVYAIEPGGQLRWVQSEAVALALYGANWNQHIDDLPDAFFFNYNIVAPLAAPIYPSGTIVKRQSDNAYFRIEDRQKRLIVSADVRTALRVQDKFVLIATSSLTDYADGSAISNAEPAITDTAQKQLVPITVTPTFTVITPSSSYIAVGGDAVLLEINLSSAKAVTVSQLTTRLDATTGAPVADKVDDDISGLVYGNNAQTNLRQLRWIDDSGQEVFGRKEIALDISQDQSQRQIWTGAWRIGAGESRRLRLVCQTNMLLTSGHGYKMTVLATETRVVDALSGGSVSFVPTTDLTGPSLTTLNAALEVSRSTVPGSVTYIRGAKNATISGLDFKATTVSPNVIKTITFQGYIDEESDGTMLPGSDVDNGSATAVRDMVPQVSLYDSKGVFIAGPVSVDLNGRVMFSNLTITIPPGQSLALVVRGDISSTIELENKPNRLMFDITDASTDVSVVDDHGLKVNALGQLPNGGDKPLYFMTVKKNGTMAIRWTGGGGNVIAGREASIGSWFAEPKEDDYLLRTISFRQVDTIAKSVFAARLEYIGADGKATSISRDFLGNNVTFSGLAVNLPRDKRTELKLYVQVISRMGGATYGESIKVQFGQTDAYEFVSNTDGQVYSATALGAGDFTISANTTSSHVVRYSSLTGARDTNSPTSAYRDAESEVLVFTLKAEPEGPVRIKKLVFRLAPSDVGITGTQNDALELWGTLSGDAADDELVAELALHTAEGQQVIGEDSSTTMRYCIAQGSARQCTPVAVGYVSGGGDAGVLEYIFSDGNELQIAAGTVQKFTFKLYTAALNGAAARTVTTELLGGSELQWTDIVSGAYTTLYAADASGFPISSGSVKVAGQ